MRARICFYLLILSFFCSFGQNQISIYGGYGFCVPHHANMWNYINRHSYQFDLSYSSEMDSVLQSNKNIRKGIAASFIDLGNPEVMGYAAAVYPELQFPLSKSKHQTWFILGCGLEYNTKTYSSENYRFNAISSHFNAHIVIGFKKDFNLSENLKLGAKFQWTHFSNSANKSPNLGLNIPSIGLEISHNSKKAEKEKVAKKNIFKNPSWTFALNGGQKQVKINGKHYPTLNFSAEKNLSLNNRNYWCFGSDIIADFSMKYRLNEAENANVTNSDNLKIAIKSGWINNIGNLQICLQAGTYLKNSNFKKEFLFERLCIRYRFTEIIGANISLRAHFAKADALETGLIINLPKK